jgi:hypothetical protein
MTNTETQTTTRQCGRCDGEKVIEQFRHVNGGICALCSGTGTRPARKATATRTPSTRKPRAPKVGANDRLWAAFTEAYPTEAATIWAKRAEVGYGNAYSAVATFDEKDSNPDAALAIYRRTVAN